ncbi:MAG: hypothetical protein KKE51_09480 [Gammaproteobacteria bacterium]|nr:hypothetical protein [Gammaproteobacteria bacterium]MBU1602622.1 hypothetical protein [Gammaproteobacteria bacterium]MBU2433427.1 hypothetical protein [Gammaproteobacteria bacterium]MBU2451343.1 hypothetical protein [Gammaproteobacteria bacterium]
MTFRGTNKENNVMARKAKAVEPEKKDRGCLTIDKRYLEKDDVERIKGMSDAEIAAFNDELSARALGKPEVRAARTIQRFEGDNLDINACADELRLQVAAVNDGNMRRPEAMLVAQAHTLDALFSSLALRSQANTTAGFLDAADRYMRLALKAQSQCRTTVEALAEIKNPRPIAFVKQANISNGPQQVNNGTPAPSHAGEIINQSNELSGEAHELLPDTRASQAESRINQEVEAVGEIHRATN